MSSYKYLIAAIAILDTSSAVRFDLRSDKGDHASTPGGKPASPKKATPPIGNLPADTKIAKDLIQAEKKAVEAHEAALKSQIDLPADATDALKKHIEDAVKAALDAKDAAEKARADFEAKHPTAFYIARKSVTCGDDPAGPTNLSATPSNNPVSLAVQSWYTIWWVWLIVGLILAGLGAGIFFYMRK